MILPCLDLWFSQWNLITYDFGAPKLYAFPICNPYCLTTPQKIKYIINFGGIEHPWSPSAPISRSTTAGMLKGPCPGRPQGHWGLVMCGAVARYTAINQKELNPTWAWPSDHAFHLISHAILLPIRRWDWKLAILVPKLRLLRLKNKPTVKSYLFVDSFGYVLRCYLHVCFQLFLGKAADVETVPGMKRPT